MRDVTERKLLLDQLAQQALIDGLTQISNRRAFDEAIQREWKRSLRTAQPLSLVLIDLDFFKLMNDRYGHQSGDDCLREVAKAVRRTAQRPEDVVARYGGEELAVLLPATDLEGAEHLARSACDAVESLRIPLAGNPVAGGVVTVSCGVSTALARLEPPRCMPEALLLAADGALYQSKAQGRNRVTALPVDPEQCSEDAGAAASPAH
jgi:diguanylate cyclase (GGDEF)-like protein